ncbi:hypothetical protein [Sporosalibacterium faouarense]|uniref:hypothetical protein n=1 Tax=Sporosalibacterium faouarense TaxID=516123 RepID=UPI00141D2646|nr:hypothetical protein [Sporosalibacterium faouarense]MTI47065.1 hypothetical protein [Bacillota bacterium]
MIIKDSEEIYTIEINECKRIVIETFEGLFTKDAYTRFHSDYKNKVLPVIGTSPWKKISDIRNFKASNVSTLMNDHNKWAEENGMLPGIIIINNNLVKSQINNLNNPSVPTAFTNLIKAYKWLKTQGL